MSFYAVVFGVLAAAAGLLQFKQGEYFGGPGSDVGTKDFKKLRNNYIVVYSLMMGEPSSAVIVCIVAGLIPDFTSLDI